ncbi:MAG: hypothetical protein KatS3mg024_0279 [Armatimonadota bacterium]|nr:MAG: hypothetical protein KatS3mg024_0279 [Armatimonadota bacterium]
MGRWRTPPILPWRHHLLAEAVEERLPEAVRRGVVRQIYPECGEPCSLGDDILTSWLPALHDGPVGFEILPRNP